MRLFRRLALLAPLARLATGFQFLGRQGLLDEHDAEAAEGGVGFFLGILLILFFAVYPLYEVSIFLIRRIEKRRE